MKLIAALVLLPVAAHACGRDGDTFEHDGRCIRLFGIDAPELSQPFGKEAKERVTYYLQRYSWTCKRRYSDRYGREVATCWNGQNSLGELLVQEGYAWDYEKYSGGRYSFAEANARNKKLGLWALPGPEAPWLYRQRRKQ